MNSLNKLIGTWYCVMIDCPDHKTLFELTAVGDLRVFQTLSFEIPNIYRQRSAGVSSWGTWELDGNIIVLKEGTNGTQQKFIFEKLEGQPFLVLTTKDKCKRYLVTMSGKNKLY